MPTVSAFWGDRVSERSQVAELLADCLSRLEREDDLLSQWRAKGISHKRAVEQAPISIEPGALARCLKTQRTDLGGDSMPELGYSFSAWNGRPSGLDAAVSCTVGLHANNPGLRNSFVVNLPDTWSNAGEKISSVVTLLRAVWDPDEVVLFDPLGERSPLWTRPAE